MLPENRRYCAGTLAVLAGAFTLFCALTAASAHTQGVCSVPGDHATIQAAVDDAACETVNLGAGTFYESVTISRTVTLQGQGEDLTIVAGDINEGSIFDIQDSGVVTLTGMTIQNLQLDTFFITNLGTALVTDCTVSHHSWLWTGGIYNGDGGTMIVTGSTLQALNGYPIMNFGTALVTDCTLSGNRSYRGGGIYNGDGGTMIVTGSTLRENQAVGAVYPPDPPCGGGIYNSGSMTVTNSTLSGNSATSDGSGSGGGICNGLEGGGTMTLINSTLSGNSAEEGGGIGNWGTMTVINSTLSGNAGGIYNYDSGTAQVSNSIIADSANGADCSGSMTSLGHNIDSDGSCGLTAAGDLPQTDPLLGPLQDNDGPTLTHALLEGSPAIDSGDDTACPATDQRGVLRPQDGDGDGLDRCDIGAFELAERFFVFLPLIVR